MTMTLGQESLGTLVGRGKGFSHMRRRYEYLILLWPIRAHNLNSSLQHERWTAPVGGRNITGQYDPKVHGYHGNTLVSLRQTPPEPFDERLFQTARELPEFPFSLDPNSGYPLGLCEC